MRAECFMVMSVRILVLTSMHKSQLIQRECPFFILPAVNVLDDALKLVQYYIDINFDCNLTFSAQLTDVPKT